MKKNILFFVFTLCTISFILGQSLQFTSLSVNDGLSQATILCLLQDQQGFLWIGTADGLNRYDGSEFEVFRTKESQQNCISDNEVMALLEDKNGDIWIGTGNGLNRYNVKEGKFKIYRNAPEDSTTLSNNYITSLIEDTDGTLLIGTKFGLNRFDSKTQIFTRIGLEIGDKLERKFVKTIYRTTKNQYWIGFEHELCLLDKSTNTLLPINNVFGNTISLKGGDNILSFLEDKKGGFWVGTNKGINHFEKEKQDFSLIPNTDNMSINNIFQSTDGSMWIGTDKGLCHIVEGSMRIENYQHKPLSSSSLSNNVIHSILEDENGIMWVGTGSGLNKYDAYFSQFNTTRINEFNPNDYTSNKVWTINKSNDNILWIGSEDGLFGLDDQLQLKFRFDEKNTKLPNVSFNSMAKQADGNFWLGTYGGGLVYYDRKKNQFKNFNHDSRKLGTINSDVVKTILLSQDEKILWIGTPKGLNRMSLSDKKISFHQFHSKDGSNIKANSIIHLYEDQNKMLWVGTEGGLVCYEYQKDSYKMFKHDLMNPASISHDFIRTIFQSKDKTIWVGTSRGLNRWDVDKMTFDRYTVEDGLSNDVIYSIEEDEAGFLWLATNKGIAKFDPNQSTFVNFHYQDGLQSNEFNTNASFKDEDGTMYFGGINGFNRFNPEDIKTNSYPPRVYIRSIETISQKGDRKHNYDNTNDIKLSSVKDFFITINFNALNYSNPQDNEYRYMLEGIDSEWRAAGNNQKAMYTNLPGGNYTFKVVVRNNEKWIHAPATLKIKVSSPFTKTWFFFLCLAILFLGLSYLFFRIYLHQIKERNQELEAIVKERTQDLIHQKKSVEESEILFRSIYENSPIGIAYFKKESGFINRCNKRLCEMLGYSEEELLGKKISDFTPKEDLENDKIRYKKAKNEKKAFWYRRNKRLIHKNGTIVNTSTSLFFSWNKQGKLDYSIIMFNDLTNEREAEKRLKQTQTQLLHADKMASLGQLTAGVAHEINNPVNFIYAGINGLKKNLKALLKVMDKYDQIQSLEGFESKRQEINSIKEKINYGEVRVDIQELTLAIEDGAARTADIVQSLQTFSRADKNERQLANIHEGLDSTLQILNKQISDHIILVKEYDSELPLLDCFPGQLNQVYLNILLNAIHAIGDMPSGKIIIKTKHLKETEGIKISFENNGPIIPEKVIDRIFDPFFTTKEIGKGTGLGLSISYGIILDHQGKIWVETNESKSTTFHIELPFARKK